MAVKLRLSRTGKRSQANYRLLAIDEHKKRDGRFVEILGFYNPHNTAGLVAKKDRVDYWLSVGAKPSATVGQLLRKIK